MQRPARRTGAAGAGLLEAEHSLHLAQLGIHLLELGRLAHDHVQAEVVPPRHLVDEPAEIPLELGELGRQEVASRRQLRRLHGPVAGSQLGGSALAPRWPAEVVGDRGHLITCTGVPAPGSLLSFFTVLPEVATLLGRCFDASA